MIGVGATALTPTLDRWRARLQTYPDRAATRIADTAQAKARDSAPKRTEAMAQSVSVISRVRNDYGPNIAGAASRNADAEFFPEPAMPDAGAALVAVGVTYGALVNDGTLHQPATGWFDQAVLETAQALPALAATEWAR